MRVYPPKKKAGQPTGPRRFAGAVLDVHMAAELIGTTEKLIRSRVARRLIPFHRLSGRVVFMRDELLEYHRRLPGCGVDEALQNLGARRC